MNSKLNGSAKIIRRLETTFSSAMRRNKKFNLGLLYINNIMQQTHCAYSGVKFSENTKNKTMTLERINNELGYIEGNVIPVSLELNLLRGSHTIEELEIKKDEAHAKMLRSASVIDIDRNLTVEELILTVPKDKMKPIIDWNNSKTITQTNIDRMLGQIDGWKKEQELKNIVGLRNNAIEAHTRGVEKRLKTIECLNAKIIEYANKYGIKTGLAEHTFNENKQLVENLTLLINAIKRFENLSKLDKMKIGVGVSLNTPMVKLLKIKLAYNLLGGKL